MAKDAKCKLAAARFGLDNVEDGLLLLVSPGQLQNEGIVQPWFLAEDTFGYQFQTADGGGQGPDYG